MSITYANDLCQLFFKIIDDRNQVNKMSTNLAHDKNIDKDE
jgi:hypothetical protein